MAAAFCLIVATDGFTFFRRKFFRDFCWSAKVHESFDSAPPDGQKKNDSSVALALGWSF
jgi:hypothetical protein